MAVIKKSVLVGLIVASLTFLSATAQPPKDGAPKDAPQKAICVLRPTKDSRVSGVVTFTVKGDEVVIKGEVKGLTPGKHGFHIHEFGDISAPDGLATGGHFNPEKEKHGAPHGKERHVGDLGNLEADGGGTALFEMTDKLVQLHGKHSVIGRGLIVHAKADDLTTQPTGDAGGRVAQGVIGIAKNP